MNNKPLNFTYEDWDILLDGLMALASRESDPRYPHGEDRGRRQRAVAMTYQKVVFRLAMLSDDPINVPVEVRKSPEEWMKSVNEIASNERIIETYRKQLFGDAANEA